MSLRDDVNKSYEIEEEKDEKDKRDNPTDEVHTSNSLGCYENDYCYDCSHCAFHNFMAVLGFDMNIDTCWIDCTYEIYNEVNEVFGFILENTLVNQQNAVLYTALISDKYIHGKDERKPS